MDLEKLNILLEINLSQRVVNSMINKLGDLFVILLGVLGIIILIGTILFAIIGIAMGLKWLYKSMERAIIRKWIIIWRK